MEPMDVEEPVDIEETSPMSPKGAGGATAKSPLPSRRRRRSIFGKEARPPEAALPPAAPGAADDTCETPPSSPKPVRPVAIDTTPPPNGRQQDNNLSPVTQNPSPGLRVRKPLGQQQAALPPPQEKQGCFARMFSCFGSSTPKAATLLPPAASPVRKTLVIDLDETLVHAEFKNIPGRNVDESVSVKWRGRVCTAFICIRPGCKEFLETLSQHYELVIFTASVSAYCDMVLSKIDPTGLISYKLYRQDCDQKAGNLYLKDLGKLGRDLNKVVIIDDRPEAYGLHPQNAIPIYSWCDDAQDQELIMATKLLVQIASEASTVTALAQLDQEHGWNRCS